MLLGRLDTSDDADDEWEAAGSMDENWRTGPTLIARGKKSPLEKVAARQRAALAARQRVGQSGEAMMAASSCVPQSLKPSSFRPLFADEL